MDRQNLLFVFSVWNITLKATHRESGHYEIGPHMKVEMKKKKEFISETVISVGLHIIKIEVVHKI